MDAISSAYSATVERPADIHLAIAIRTIHIGGLGSAYNREVTVTDSYKVAGRANHAHPNVVPKDV